MGQTQFCACLAPLRPDITTLGDMVISSISVSTHVVKSLTNKQLYFFKLSWAWQVMRGLILSGLDCTWYDMIQKSDLSSLVQLLALCLVFLFLLTFAVAVCPLLKKDCFTLAFFNCELGFSSGMINWSLNWSWQLLLIAGHLCYNVLEVHEEISISWSATSVNYLFPIL